ncbi:MAG: hypothetical protein EA359_09295 [Balneolaceae bacterium]|nr:MAG: hypothetical protein EA359_09295 [Balneolaceae bacterium]
MASNLRFQIIIDTKDIFISTTPDGKIRVNITGIELEQLDNIVDAVQDAGNEAAEYFLNLVNKKLLPGKDIHTPD